MQAIDLNAHARRRSAAGHWAAIALLAALSIVILIPLLWTFSMALKPDGEIYTNNFFPRQLEFGNFGKAIRSIPFFLFLGNTVRIVVLDVIGDVLTSSLVAYGFSRFQFKGKRVWFLVLLATMMLPGQVRMIPQFLMFRMLGWVNTPLPLIVPSYFGTNAFNIFLLRQFMGGIPKDFDEAAVLDGAGPLRIYRSVIMPMCVPVLTAITVFVFMGAWNDFNGPLIYLNNQKNFTLAVGLAFFKGQYVSRWNLMMAAMVLIMLPVLVLFFAAQEYIIEGISISSGTKG
jgi:multiple sugar transport system permease protein